MTGSFFNMTGVDSEGYPPERVQLWIRLMNLSWLIVIPGIYVYVWAWKRRTTASITALLDDQSSSKGMSFAKGLQLGRESELSILSSVMIMDKRIFITLRILMGLYSTPWMLMSWKGLETLIIGGYFPMATILCIYVSLNPTLIETGLRGNWKKYKQFVGLVRVMQFPGKFILDLCYWYSWFGMIDNIPKRVDVNRFVAFNLTVVGGLFFAIEIFFADLTISMAGIFHLVFIWALVFAYLSLTQGIIGRKSSPVIMARFNEFPVSTARIGIFLTLGSVVVHSLICLFASARTKLLCTNPKMLRRIEGRNSLKVMNMKRHTIKRRLSFTQRKTIAARKSMAAGRKTTSNV